MELEKELVSPLLPMFIDEKPYLMKISHLLLRNFRLLTSVEQLHFWT